MFSSFGFKMFYIQTHNFLPIIVGKLSSEQEGKECDATGVK